MCIWVFLICSFLKIHHVQDLPDKYKWKSKADHPVTGQETLGQHHSAIVEESAATPPNYKYNEARLIPLEESMQIQQAQQRHQEVREFVSKLIFLRKVRE